MHASHEAPSPQRNPIAHRSFFPQVAAFLALLSTSPEGTRAEPERWTASDVVRMARARAPRAAVQRERAGLARARTASTGLPPDPSLDWQREQTFAGADPSQDIVSLTVPIDLSGRRRGERALARSDATRARAEAELGERTAISGALITFYAALAAGRRVAAAETRIEALDEVERILDEREAAGASSGYERARLGIEAELARSRLASRRTDARTARDRLAALLGHGQGEPPELEGELGAGAPPPVHQLMGQARASHPALRHARTSIRAAADAEDAASTAWIPTLSLTGGYNLQQDRQSDPGYVVGVGFTLPIFTRDRGLAERAKARRRLARAETRALRWRLRRRIVQARSRLVAAREELARFEEATADHVDTLLRGATTGYEEGQRPLRDVLDAHRVATDVRLRRIELAFEAKRADVELRRATGGWR